MLFNSVDFILFFPIVVIIYYLIPQKIRYIWLLVCSYYFYMCWNPKYILLILFSTVATYVGGLAIEKVKRSVSEENRQRRLKKLCVAGTVVVNLLILGYFKYFNFFIWNINMALRKCGIELVIPQFSILLPVGISFYTFQALSYTIDVYRGEIYAEKNFLKYALFVSFFPQLVAGPIERSKNLLRQINERHHLEFRSLQTGMFFMLWGFVLKLVLADRIAIFVDSVYGHTEEFPGFYIVAATVFFGIQIYCDFAGYTMIARGAAKILGFELMENFRAPYFAKSVSEFWRRWHISLTSWFRDYLYIPLGGNRKGRMRKYSNIMIVFITSGLWHGASWTYIIWGALNGIYQVVGDLLKPLGNAVTDKLGIRRQTFSHRILQTVFTFILVDFAWLFFRVDGLKEMVKTLKNLFCFNPWILIDGSLFQLGLDEKIFHFILFMVVVLFVVDYIKYKGISLMDKICSQGIWFRAILAAVLFWIIIMLGVYGVSYEASQFIYFQF